MTLPIPEIIVVTYSETKGYTDIAKVFDQATGLQKAFHGRQEENEKVAVWVNVWDTLEHRDTSVKNASSSPLFQQLSETFVSTAQASLTEPFIHVLSAPTTEFVTIRLKPGHTKAELDPVVDDLRRELRKGVTKGCHGNSYGPSVEEPGEVVVGVVGWDSVAAHWEAVKGKSLAAVIERLMDVADGELTHANLTLYTPA